MVCRALAGIIAEFLSWLALSAQKGEDPDELYEEFLAQLRVHWKDPRLEPSNRALEASPHGTCLPWRWAEAKKLPEREYRST